MRARRTWFTLGLLAAIALLAVVPLIDIPTAGLLPDRLSAPGSLQLLGLCLVFGALALTYDLLFGFTGLLSFGHALYFAAGVYAFDIALTVWHLPVLAALGVTLAFAIALPLAIGAVSLRTGGIAFAMVTLAFAQAGSIIAETDPGGLTGGELGLGLSYKELPSIFVGVFNTQYLYWLALALLVCVSAVAWWITRSVPGRFWRAIRENELRVEVLGLRPYTFKLLAFVVAGFLAALCGIVYLLLVAGAHPTITSATFTLSLLVMVVLGGTGTGWGAVLGGVIYTYLNLRLGALASAPVIQHLPGPIRVPLSQPMFILGLILVLVVLFMPGGIAGFVMRRRAARTPLTDIARRLRKRADVTADGSDSQPPHGHDRNGDLPAATGHADTASPPVSPDTSGWRGDDAG